MHLKKVFHWLFFCAADMFAFIWIYFFFHQNLQNQFRYLIKKLRSFWSILLCTSSLKSKKEKPNIQILVLKDLSSCQIDKRYCSVGVVLTVSWTSHADKASNKYLHSVFSKTVKQSIHQMSAITVQWKRLSTKCLHSVCSKTEHPPNVCTQCAVKQSLQQISALSNAQCSVKQSIQQMSAPSVQ